MCECNFFNDWTIEKWRSKSHRYWTLTVFFFPRKDFSFHTSSVRKHAIFQRFNFFRADSVKMSLFVSRQMNWKALFSVTFWFGKEIFPKSRRQPNSSSMLKNWCCFSGCMGTAEIIDEKDHHKLSRESVEHFMTKRLEI